MRYILVAAGILLSATALADDGRLDTLLPALQQGGYVLVMRHAATDPRTEDDYPPNYEDMTKQRQLSEQGKQVARQTANVLNALAVPIGKVFTSRLNRAVETGQLVAGKPVTPREDLTDSVMGSASAMAGASTTGNWRYAAALRQLVNTRPELHTNTLIVTHKTNIRDAFGNKWADIRESECLVFKPNGAGSPTPVARIQASEWFALAHSPRT